MSSPEARIAAIEADLARNRTELARSAFEIARRLKPANLVDAAIERISGKAIEIAGDAIEAAKQHAGQATLFGAGALLAFDIGRRAADPTDSPSPTSVEDEAARLSAATVPPPTPLLNNIGNLPTVLTYWGGGLAAAAAGYSIAKAVPVSEAEEQLLGGLSRDLKTSVAFFWREHAQGARQTGAQAFGVAGMAAAGLAIMAAFAELIGGGRGHTPRNGAEATRP